jgi:hypothetical protein
MGADLPGEVCRSDLLLLWPRHPPRIAAARNIGQVLLACPQMSATTTNQPIIEFPILTAVGAAIPRVVISRQVRV